MNKKILIIIICMFLVGLTYAYIIQKNDTTLDFNTSTLENTTQNSTINNNDSTKTMSSAKVNDVIVIQKGPDKPQKRGTEVPIYYIVINRGVNTVYDMKIGGQDFTKNFGVLKPGETKKFTYMEYIPTDSDIEEDMPGAGPLPNPYYIGSPMIDFRDSNGVVHKVQSNYIIKWYN